LPVAQVGASGELKPLSPTARQSMTAWLALDSYYRQDVEGCVERKSYYLKRALYGRLFKAIKTTNRFVVVAP
jgi:hypothetical protein